MKRMGTVLVAMSLSFSAVADYDYTTPIGKGHAVESIGNSLYEHKGGVYDHTVFREAVSACMVNMLEFVLLTGNASDETFNSMMGDMVEFWELNEAQRTTQFNSSAVNTITGFYEECADTVQVPRSMQ